MNRVRAVALGVVLLVVGACGGAAEDKTVATGDGLAASVAEEPTKTTEAPTTTTTAAPTTTAPPPPPTTTPPPPTTAKPAPTTTARPAPPPTTTPATTAKP